MTGFDLRIDFDIISEHWDTFGLVSVKDGSVTIDCDSVCDGSYKLSHKDKLLAERFFKRSLAVNNIVFLDKLLDFFQAPRDLTFKQRLAWYKLMIDRGER